MVLNLDLRRILHILRRISKMKYKAVFEESFREIHMNSRQNFHVFGWEFFRGYSERLEGRIWGGIRGDLHGV